METIALSTDSLDQRRVVVSSDGGRIRIRKDKRGPRTKKGRRRYHTGWKEPKLVIMTADLKLPIGSGAISKTSCYHYTVPPYRYVCFYSRGPNFDKQWGL